MSFPSAPKFFEDGLSAEQALLAAFRKDTPDGFAYVTGLVTAYQAHVDEPVARVQESIPCAGCASKVLRSEWLSSGGLAVDVDPNSKLGSQVMRLLGTDMARSLLERHFGVTFALANCCKGIVGGDRSQTLFTAEDQIRWQHSIDC